MTASVVAVPDHLALYAADLTRELVIRAQARGQAVPKDAIWAELRPTGWCLVARGDSALLDLIPDQWESHRVFKEPAG